MFLVAVSSALIVIFIILFFLISLSLILLIFYTLNYIQTSRKEKRLIYNDLNTNAIHNSIVFLGDSLTDFYRTSEFFLSRDIYNRGIAGDTTDDVLKRLNDNVLSINPRKIFLQIGTNDLEKNKKPQYIIDNIKKIIAIIQQELPETSIYIISLYPVNALATPFSRIFVRSRKNHDLDFINEELLKYACENNITYIDVSTHLKDVKGNLKKEYTVEGLHISILGYAKISEILKPFVN